MYGYPVNLWDQSNMLPLVRTGLTASLPYVDFNDQPLGVVDMANYPGNSGAVKKICDAFLDIARLTGLDL